MSHVEKAVGTISDDPKLLECIEKALLANFPKAHLLKGKKTYNWYGRHVGDHPLPEGFKADELGVCEHAISLDGCGYEVGLVKSKKGKGYSLLFDFWGTGQKLRESFGAGCEKLTDAINVEVMKAKAKRAGYEFTTKKLDSGATVLTVNQNVGVGGF